MLLMLYFLSAQMLKPTQEKEKSIFFTAYITRQDKNTSRQKKRITRLKCYSATVVLGKETGFVAQIDFFLFV